MVNGFLVNNNQQQSIQRAHFSSSSDSNISCLQKKLQNNYFSAVSELKNLQKRLQKDPSLNQTCNQTLQTDLNESFVKSVEIQASPPGSIWYFPHHPASNPNIPEKELPTKHQKFAVNRNSNLLTGPKLLNNLKFC